MRKNSNEVIGDPTTFRFQKARKSKETPHITSCIGDLGHPDSYPLVGEEVDGGVGHQHQVGTQSLCFNN